MSHKDDQYPLRTFAEEGGRLTFGCLTDGGLLAASRLAGAGRAWIGPRAEGWDLVLARLEPGL